MEKSNKVSIVAEASKAGVPTLQQPNNNFGCSMPNQVLTCILNDTAGSHNAAEARALISRVASERGWEARVLLSSAGADLPGLAEQARAAGGLVVSGGGDGTIRQWQRRW